MFKSVWTLTIVHCALIIIFSLWSLKALFHPGLMYSHDSLWHVQRLQNMATEIGSQFPVRWSPSLDHGYGIPLFNFTYPLPYYLGALMMFAGLGPIAPYNLLLFLSYFMGGLGILMLGRAKPLYGLIAALLYLLSPYWFLDIFVRGALGEVMALGLIPWVFLTLQGISRSGRLAWYAPIPLALLFLAHNFYGFLFAGLLVFFTATLYKHKRLVFTSLLLSLGLAAFFVVPALAEQPQLLISQAASLGYKDHFLSLTDLIATTWGYLGSSPGHSSGEMSYQLGIAGIVVLVIALAFTRRLLIYLIPVVFSILLTLPLSTWLWTHLPLVASLQFPWRFVGVVIAIIPLIYLDLAQVIVKGKKETSFRIFSLLLIVLALWNTSTYKSPSKWLTDSEFLTLHYEYMGQTTTAYRSELVPKYAPVERFNPIDPNLVAGTRLALREGSAQITEAVETPLSLRFSASADSASEALWYRNYYPSWSATMDGNKITLTPSETGEILVSLAPGSHDYTIVLESTMIARLANLISILSLCAILSILWRQRSG